MRILKKSSQLHFHSLVSFVSLRETNNRTRSIILSVDYDGLICWQGILEKENERDTH